MAPPLPLRVWLSLERFVPRSMPLRLDSALLSDRASKRSLTPEPRLWHPFPASGHFHMAGSPVRFPCYYGIDMPSKKELMGAWISVDEIAADLGVNSLGYLSLDGLVDTVAESGPFYAACFSGEYSAPLVDLKEKIEHARQFDLSFQSPARV